VSEVSAYAVELPPAQLADGSYLARNRLTRIGVAGTLGTMICLLDLIPATLIVPGMTDVGRPALIIALGLFCWWVLVRLNPRLLPIGSQPMRWVVMVYLTSELVSYGAGFLRGLSPIESNGADRELLAAAGFVGVILMASDGIPNWRRLNGLLRVFVWCSTFMALVGILQFMLRIDITQYMTIPGLQPKGYIVGFEDRGGAGIFRVASTAYHYIEFSAVMAMALPFAIHFARFAPNVRHRKWFIIAALSIAAAIPLTVSRTGILACVIVLVCVVPTWNWRTRYNVLIFATALLVGLGAVKPGIRNTLTGLFTNASNDTSVQARTERYGLVSLYFSQRPWLGRGTGTWLAPMYQILDNQWFGTALSTGLVGVAALATLHIGGIVVAGISLRRATRAEERHLCAALIGVQLAAILAEFTFDAFAFSTYRITLALLLGISGAVWRLTHPERTASTARRTIRKVPRERARYS
jgi:hypothetical protein